MVSDSFTFQTGNGRCPANVFTPAENVALILYGSGHRNKPIAEELTLDGFHVHPVSDTGLLSARCPHGDVDLVLFADGHRAEALRALRSLRSGELGAEVDSAVRVLWISASDGTSEVLRAFEAGADDVIRSPFTYAELLAHLRALLRRNTANTPTLIECGPLSLDTDTYTATFAQQPVELRRLEYGLLLHLARDPGRVHTKHELLGDVWGYRSPGATCTVDSHACRTRRALARAGADAEGWIIAVRGVGYLLKRSTASYPEPLPSSGEPTAAAGAHYRR